MLKAAKCLTVARILNHFRGVVIPVDVYEVPARRLSAWSQLKNGGILIFDDYQWTDPMNNLMAHEVPGPAIDFFMSVYQGQYTLLHKEYQVILRKDVP